jgi:hypothetical protein
MKVDRQKIGGDWAYFIDMLAECAQPEMKAGDILPGGELEVVATTTQEVAQALTELVQCAGEQLAGESVPAVVEDLHLENPDDVEFAIFSSGGLDIYCGEMTVSLNKAVFTKLCRFTGLFQEAA